MTTRLARSGNVAVATRIADIAPTAAFRRAAAGDAPAISILYREMYDPGDGGSPEEAYPYPEFMRPAQLGKLLESDQWTWCVATANERIVGVVGAAIARCGGGKAPLLADVVGFVVDPAWQRKGIGAGLLAQLEAELADTVDCILAETRTAVAASWITFRRAGYGVIGLEPFCHATPAGREAMLLQIKAPRTGPVRRTRPGPLKAIADLVDLQFAAGIEPTCVPSVEPRGDELAVHVRQLRHAIDHVLGAQGNRIRRVALTDGTASMAGEWDRIDRRLYVTSFRCPPESADCDSRMLLSVIHDFCLTNTIDSVAIDVPLTSPLAGVLCSTVSFVPTALYPGLLRTNGAPTDVVQFSSILAGSGSLPSLEAFERDPMAHRLVAAVLSSLGAVPH